MHDTHMADYNRPFPDSIEVKVSRPTGTYAHENFPESKYAIDFLLEQGTSILAARGGKIIKVKSDSDKYFRPEDLRDKTLDEIVQLANTCTNYVGIQHDDGTYTEYWHLAKDGVAVKEGQEVKQGDLLGYTGWSGIMDAPGLHFNAFMIKDGKAISIPTNLNDLT